MKFRERCGNVALFWMTLLIIPAYPKLGLGATHTEKKGADSAAHAVWTLRRCEDTAVASSYRIQRSQLAVSQAASDFREADASRRGSFDLSGNYGYVSETMALKLALPTFPGSPPSPTIKFGDGSSYDLAAGVRVPIYAGGALKLRSDMAATAVQSAKFDLAVDSLKTLYDVRIAYFTAMGTESRLQTATNSSERLKRHLAELDSAIKYGAGSLEARLQAAGRLDQTEAAVALAEGDARAARLALANLVGSPGAEVAALDSSNLSLLSQNQSTEDVRPDIISLQRRIEGAANASAIARAAWLPTVSLAAGFHHAKPGIDLVKNAWMDYFTGGVNVSWTIYDWGARVSRIEKAEAISQSMELRLSELKDANNTGIAAARARLDAANLAADATDHRLGRENERKSLVERRYKLGAATESELLDMLDDLTQAENDRDGARIRCRLAEVDYLWATASRPQLAGNSK